MKQLLFLLLGFVLSMKVSAQSDAYFGKKISSKPALAATELPKKMDNKETMNARVMGTVESVCQAKGCWMNVKLDNGETMRVTFRDYGFFVPKDITGKTVVFEGDAQNKIIPVAELRHYAQDAGKSPAEVANITHPKQELTFVADGVIVR
jgi:hypothetical protein